MSVKLSNVYTVTWSSQIVAKTPEEAVAAALKRLRGDHLDGVQFAVTCGIWATDAAVPDEDKNRWDLYESVAGWEECAKGIDQAWEERVPEFEHDVAACGDPAAAHALVRRFYADFLDNVLIPNARFGAADTEPRGILMDRLAVIVGRTAVLVA